MNDQLPAYIRTYIPMLVAALGTYLAKHGLNVDSLILQALVGTAIGAAYYAAVRFMEAHQAWFGWLLGMAKAPAYSTAPAPSPGPGQDVTAVVTPAPGADGGDGGFTLVELCYVVIAVSVAVLALVALGWVHPVR